MEDNLIKNFKKLWPEHSYLYLDLDFQIIYNILSSDKLKNENPHTVWNVMHDWIKMDTFNRLTYFKVLFKKCLPIESLQFQFVENSIFQSDIFRLLPLEFQKDLKKFFNKKSLLFCIDSFHGSVQFYDIQHKNWHSSPVSLKLPYGQNCFQLALFGSMLYAFGGRVDDYKATNEMWSSDMSDPWSQWTTRANMKQSRKEFSSVVLNDTIYALGGEDNNRHLLRSCERYDSHLNKWSTVADMNSGRENASAAVINGCIYVAGGYNGFEVRVSKSVCKYCPETDTWRKVAPMTIERELFSLTPFAGRLWAIGGRDGHNQYLRSCESYDPVTDTWREEAPMKEERWKHAAIEFNGELYVVGGCRNNRESKVVEKYVSTIGWVEDSQLQKFCNNPQLLIIPAYSSLDYTTDQNKNNKKFSCKIS